MGNLKSVSLPIILAFVIFIAMVILNVFNTGSPGGADPYNHYVIARWAFNHPQLFFDQWGKPLYTILVAPFTLLGFKWAVSFNIILSVLSGLLVYKSAIKLGIKNAWLGIIFTVFTPIFFYVSFSTLTEIIFAFIITLTAYLFIAKKYAWSAIVLSFIPFARTEGVIFFPVLILALLVVKKYKTLPLIFTGFIVMSLVGYPFMNDLWWAINTIPYAADSSGIYGNGDMMHFINYSPYLFGLTLLLLFAIGAFHGLLVMWRDTWSHQSAIMVLLLGVSFGYFAAHSVVWALGMGGSLGLVRVIAGIAPIVALVALMGFNSLISPINGKQKITFGLSVILSIVLIKQAFTKNNFPINEGVEMVVVHQATNYLQETGLDRNFVIYYNPIVAFLLDIDPYSRERGAERFQDPKDFDVKTPIGAIFLWEAHFAPSGNQVPIELIESNSDFVRIKDFQPHPPFQVHGDKDYEVILFQKVQ